MSETVTGQFNYYRQRQQTNQLSALYADRSKAPWTPDELDLLGTWNVSESELTEMAYVLGRTREACRVRYYLERRKAGLENVPVKMPEAPAALKLTSWDDEGDGPSWYVR